MYLKSFEYWNQAREKFKEGNFKKSIELHDEAIKFSPLNYEIYYSKAKVLLCSNSDLDSVVFVFEKIHELYLLAAKEPELKKYFTDEVYIQFYYEKGLLYYSIKNYEKSIECLNQVLELRKKAGLNSFDFQWITLLGNAFFAIGELDSAIVYYNEGFELEESDEVGMYIKKDYYSQFYDGNHDTYLKVFSEGIEKAPEVYSFYMYRGEIKVMKNDFIGALADFTKAAILQSTTHNWINKSAMELKVGDPANARKDFALVKRIK